MREQTLGVAVVMVVVAVVAKVFGCGRICSSVGVGGNGGGGGGGGGEGRWKWKIGSKVW